MPLAASHGPEVGTKCVCFVKQISLPFFNETDYRLGLDGDC